MSFPGWSGSPASVVRFGAPSGRSSTRSTPVYASGSAPASVARAPVGAPRLAPAPRQRSSGSGFNWGELLFGGGGSEISMQEFPSPEVPDFESIYERASRASDIYGASSRSVVSLYQEMAAANQQALDGAREAAQASFQTPVTPTDLSAWMQAQQNLSAGPGGVLPAAARSRAMLVGIAVAVGVAGFVAVRKYRSRAKK